MAKSVNEVRLLGNLGADADLKHTSGGIAVATLSVATTRRVKSGDEWKDVVDWHRVTLWRCEKLAQYLTKGTRVHLSGYLQTRSFKDRSGEDRYVTEVIVGPDGVILLGAPNGANRQTSEPALSTSARLALSPQMSQTVFARQ